MYYLKFIIKDYTTKEVREKVSEPYDNIETAINIIEKYLIRQRNYINIKKLGSHKILIIKNGGEILVEIFKK